MMLYAKGEGIPAISPLDVEVPVTDEILSIRSHEPAPQDRDGEHRLELRILPSNDQRLNTARQT